MEETKVCTECGGHQEESFAMELLRGYKRQFAIVTAILSAIILLLIGCIAYDNWQDGLYDTVAYTQDGEGNNVVGDNNNQRYYGSDFKDEATQG